MSANLRLWLDQYFAVLKPIELVPNSKRREKAAPPQNKAVMNHHTPKTNYRCRNRNGARWENVATAEAQKAWDRR